MEFSELISKIREWIIWFYVHFWYLGRILETVVGTTFEKYVQEKILNPLGMTSTGFDFTPEVLSRMAVGYEQDGSVAPIFNMGMLDIF